MSPAAAREPDMVGPYRLLHRLGEGGMGVVHLGLDEEGRAVAVKVLKPHVAGDPDARRRLAREVQTLRRVQHPRVASVIDADVEGDRPYLITHFVPGKPLDAHVKEHGPLPRGHVARIGKVLAEALRAIHAAGIVHRDVKPANVMLLDGDPVLIDFGIAHIADESRITQTGLVMGTPGYLSPEVIAGDPVTAATDWWGWGATLAYAATGRPPFGTGPIEVILDRVRRGETDLKGIDPGLAATLSSALAIDSRTRPEPALLVAGLAAVPGRWANGAAANGAGNGAGKDAEGVTEVVPAPPVPTRAQVLTLPEPDPVTLRQAPPSATRRFGPPTAARGAAPHVSAGSQVGAAAQVSPAPQLGAAPQVSADPQIRWAPPPPYSPPAYSPPAYSPPPSARPPSTAPSSTAPSSTAPSSTAPSSTGTGTGTGTELDGDPRGGVWRPPGNPDTGVLMGLVFALAAIAAVAPYGAVWTTGLLMLVARVVDRSRTGLLRRRDLRGARGGDGVVVVLGLPWHALTAAVATVFALILPVLVGISVAFIVASAQAGEAATARPGSPLSLAGGMVALLLTAWWGPGGGSLRHGARATAILVSSPRWGQLAVWSVLGLALIAALLMIAGGAEPDWGPLGGRLANQISR